MSLQEKMFALVEEYHQSGLSAKLFCEGKGISPSKLYYWIRKKRDQNETGFIKITTDATITSVPVELIYPNGVRLQLPASDLDVITELIKAFCCFHLILRSPFIFIQVRVICAKALTDLAV